MLNVEVSKARIGKLESTLIVSRISAEALAGVVRAEAKLICTQRGRQQEIFYRNLAVKAPGKLQDEGRMCLFLLRLEKCSLTKGTNKIDPNILFRPTHHLLHMTSYH